MQDEISRLRAELGTLESRETGLLGEVDRLDAQLRLREVEVHEASLRLEAASEAILDHDFELRRLEGEQRERSRYLGFRLREIYKRGPEGGLERLLGGGEVEVKLRGLQYAAYLSERDARTLRAYREVDTRLRVERDALARERVHLATIHEEGERARVSLARSRAERIRALERIQGDLKQRHKALGELESASRELGRLVGRLGGEARGAALDARKFRGLLDWPARGRISAGFGVKVHPRFRTAIPHPGLDIEAEEGSEFRSIFDGRVAFASRLHGYGLVVIVDHGTGVISIYAHASVLLVEEGEQVVRGQLLGRVGDTGSLRGPYLYLEIREQGKPVDPVRWLRRRSPVLP